MIGFHPNSSCPPSASSESGVAEVPLLPITNHDAQLISSGNFCLATACWHKLLPMLESKASSDEIVEAFLKSDPHLIKWISFQSEATFQNAVQRIAGQKLPVLRLIHLAALAQTGKFTPYALFYLFYRTLLAEPEKKIETVIQDLLKTHPRILFYLKSQSLDHLKHELTGFCYKVLKGKADHIDTEGFLTDIYSLAIEESELFDLTLALEHNNGEGLKKCMERASPEYWMQFCAKEFQDTLSQKQLKEESLWKKLFIYLRTNAYFPPPDYGKKGHLMSELSALSRDISYFDPRHPDGKELRFLIKQPHLNGSSEFPNCYAHIDELQRRIDLCRQHFQPKKILAAYKEQCSSIHEMVQAKKDFSKKLDTESFFMVFSKPIYKASAIYLFSVLRSSEKELWPQVLFNAWSQAEKRFNLYSFDRDLEFSEYEEFIYYVWNQFSAENPNSLQMDLPDLLKRRIAGLDSDSLCELYLKMTNRTNQVPCHEALLTFFSNANGRPNDIHWLLEDML